MKPGQDTEFGNGCQQREGGGTNWIEIHRIAGRMKRMNMLSTIVRGSRCVWPALIAMMVLCVHHIYE
jgi:hypothetical protein